MNPFLNVLNFLFLAAALCSSPAIAQDQSSPVNPFADAVVGEWAEYLFQSDTTTSKVIVEVTAIDGDIVTVTDKMFFDDGDEPSVDVHKVDRSKPLSPYFQLMTHKLIGKPWQAESTTSEQMLIGDKKIDTIRQDFNLKSTFGVAKKKLWTSNEVPVAGVVKTSSASRLWASTTTLVTYGNAGDQKTSSNASLSTDTKKEQDKGFSSSAGVEMAYLPAGALQMGQLSQPAFLMKVQGVESQEEKLLLLTKSPPKRAAVVDNAFWIGKHEVTIGQFRKFVDATQYKTEAERSGLGGTGRLGNGQFSSDPKFTWQSYGFEAGDDCPVVNVSHGDAIAFCEWLSKQDGVKYRLPTEVEWEYACRGKTTTVYFSGDEIKDLEGFANVADLSLKKIETGLPWAASFDDGFPFLAPVGSFKANAFGLFDMHGNALEMCGTRFAMYEPLSDGTAATASALKPGTGFTVRGGNWFNDPALAGAASRSGAEPDLAMSLTGFRIVAESVPTK